MKVLMVTPRYPPNIHGGGEISCSLLVKELSKHIDINVLSFDGNIVKKRENNVTRVNIGKLQSKVINNIKAYNLLKDKIGNYDIIHTYNMELLPAVGFLTKKKNIKTVGTLNGIVYSNSLSYFKSKIFSFRYYRNKFLMKYIKNIIIFTTICQFFKEKWSEDGIPDNKIVVVPTLLDPNFPVVKKIKSNKIRFLYVGNYSPTRAKEISMLLDIYSKLKKQNISLTIVGKGKNKVAELVKIYNPKNEVKLEGEKNYNEIQNVYANADIFIHPCIYPKAMERVIFEAMCNNICVVTTGNEHYSSIIQHQKSGILIYPLSSEKFATELQNLIDNPKIVQNISKNSKKRLFDVCAPDKSAKKYLELYEEII